MSTENNKLVKQAVRENRIPFTVEDPRPNAESLEAIRDAEQFLTNGKQPRFSKAEELFEDLEI